MALVKSRNPYRKLASMRAASGDNKTTAVEKKTDPRVRENIVDESGKYNPRPLGAVRSSGRVANRSGRMFNKEGQLNAQDNRDALQQIAYLLQDVVKGAPVSPSELKKESAISKQSKREAIVAAFKDPTGEGFSLIGQELIDPIKEVVDYEGWSRKCLRVRPLAQGELFRLTKDVAYQTIAWTIGQDGQTPESRVTGRYVQGSEFKVTAFVDIDVAEIYQMQFDGLDRAQDLARQDIERKEDSAFISALNSAATTFNDLTYFTTLGVSAFEDIRYQVEKNRLVVDKFLINRAELSDLVKTMSSAVDIITQRELILSGYIGNFLNAQIVTSAGTATFEVIPAGTVYAIPAPEYLGDFGVRIDLTSDPFNKYAVNETVKGWALLEMVGVLLPNSRAISKGMK